MRTAVQLREPPAPVRAELLHGAPAAWTHAKGAAVALFEPGALVAYILHGPRASRLFVFRTLAVSDRLAAAIPGVRPRAQLLLDIHSLGRIRHVRGLFAYLVRRGTAPGDLPDDVYVRVGAALGGRLPAHAILPSLLGPR
jgi:hypothetical protein